MNKKKPDAHRRGNKSSASTHGLWCDYLKGRSSMGSAGPTGERDVPPVGARQEHPPGQDGNATPATIDYFDYIILNNAKIRRMFPGEVSREDRESWLPYVKQAATGTYTELPIYVDLPGETKVGVLGLKGSVSGRCLVLSVYGTTYLAGTPSEADQCLPIVTIAVSPGGTEGVDFWRSLSVGGPGIFVPEHARPETPWCATRISFDGGVLFYDVLPMLASLVGCIAWIWYDAMMPAAPAPQSGSQTCPVWQPQVANDDAFDIGSTGE